MQCIIMLRFNFEVCNYSKAESETELCCCLDWLPRVEIDFKLKLRFDFLNLNCLDWLLRIKIAFKFKFKLRFDFKIKIVWFDYLALKLLKKKRLSCTCKIQRKKKYDGSVLEFINHSCPQCLQVGSYSSCYWVFKV